MTGRYTPIYAYWLLMTLFITHYGDLKRLMCRQKKLRNLNINVIICAQTVKSIHKDIKKTLSDMILFHGIGKDDFMKLMKENPVGMLDKKNI